MDRRASATGSRPRTRVVDLSHRVRAGLVTYPGLPAPTISQHLTREESRTHYGADYLVEAGATLVGIDSLNIDDTESGGSRPAHSSLLGAGMPLVEHLTNLGALPAQGVRFTAAPPAIEGFGTFPVRAFAELPDRSDHPD